MYLVTHHVDGQRASTLSPRGKTLPECRELISKHIERRIKKALDAEDALLTETLGKYQLELGLALRMIASIDRAVNLIDPEAGYYSIIREPQS